MPKSGESTDHKKKKAKTDSKKVDWNKFVRRDERGSDEESDQEWAARVDSARKVTAMCTQIGNKLKTIGK